MDRVADGFACPVFSSWPRHRRDLPWRLPAQRQYFANKGPSSQSSGFSGSHAQMWAWTLKKVECLKESWTVVLEKTLESPLDCKVIKPISPKGNQSWIFIGRTVAEAEAQIFWSPDSKSWFIRKDPEAGKDLKAGGEGDEMVQWISLPTQWTWVWASSGRWSRTGKPGMLLSMGLQRVGHDWVTEQQQNIVFIKKNFWSHHEACGILVPGPAQTSAVKLPSPNHWTTREIPHWQFLKTALCRYNWRTANLTY